MCTCLGCGIEWLDNGYACMEISLKDFSCGDVLYIHNIQIDTHRRNRYAYINSTTMHTVQGMTSLKQSITNHIERSNNKDSCVSDAMISKLSYS